MAFISNTGIDYGQAFQIKSIDISLNGAFSSKSNTFSPTTFGIDPSIPFVSGLLAEKDINLVWTVERPITKEILTSFIDDRGFSGFYINFYDINRNLIFTDTNSFNNTDYSISASEIFNTFAAKTGSENAAN